MTRYEQGFIKRHAMARKQACMTKQAKRNIFDIKFLVELLSGKFRKRVWDAGQKSFERAILGKNTPRAVAAINLRRKAFDMPSGWLKTAECGRRPASRYEQGFMRKCASMGVDPRGALQLMKMAQAARPPAPAGTAVARPPAPAGTAVARPPAANAAMNQRNAEMVRRLREYSKDPEVKKLFAARARTVMNGRRAEQLSPEEKNKLYLSMQQEYDNYIKAQRSARAWSEAPKEVRDNYENAKLNRRFRYSEEARKRLGTMVGRDLGADEIDGVRSNIIRYGEEGERAAREGWSAPRGSENAASAPIANVRLPNGLWVNEEYARRWYDNEAKRLSAENSRLRQGYYGNAAARRAQGQSI